MSRKSTTVKSAHLQNSPLHLFHRLGQGSADAFSSQMRQVDLTARQFAVLSATSQNDGLSQTDLVALTGIDRSTMADIVKRMLKKGLLQRQRTNWDASPTFSRL
jgi:DNA-binding MarR family transcriptional regulator